MIEMALVGLMVLFFYGALKSQLRTKSVRMILKGHSSRNLVAW